MLLSKYLKNKDVAEFAEQIGACVSSVYHWMNFVRTPRPAMARKIVEATNNRVTLKDIYG